MTTYLYCVLAPPNPEVLPRGLSGIGGTPVRALVANGSRPIEAWVATVEDATLRVTGQALASQALVHNEIVEAAMATGRTPVPARYGTHFDDDATCIADVIRRTAQLTPILDRVAGFVEMSVLIVPNEEPSETVSRLSRPQRHESDAGRRYLESIRERARLADQRRRAADAVADNITEALNTIVRDESRSFNTIGVMALAHLVQRGRVDAYRETISRLEPIPAFRLIVAEPRAPYSFVAQEVASPGHDSSSPNRND